jgi:hypothetical protein
VTPSGPPVIPSPLGYVGWRSQTTGFTTSFELTNNLPLTQLDNDTTNHHHDQSHQSQYKLPLQQPLPASANVLYNDETLGSTTALNFASWSMGIDDHERDYPQFPQHYTTLWQIADVLHYHGLSTSPMTIVGKLGSILFACGCCRLCGLSTSAMTIRGKLGSILFPCGCCRLGQ